MTTAPDTATVLPTVPNSDTDDRKPVMQSERFHHEDDIAAAYEEAEAAVWRGLVKLAGEMTIRRQNGEPCSAAVRRFARSIADAVIRSDPSDFADITDYISRDLVEQGSGMPPTI